LGTPFEMYDDKGGRVWQGELDSFGAIRDFKGNSLTNCPFRYQGQYEDSETGLYYNRFRYYSPEEGMYISQDPIRLSSGVYSLYSYVKDTTSIIDAFGLDWNYHLTDANGKVYYHGRASDSQSMADVARRHGNNVGADGARFGKGDTMNRVTPVGTNANAVRGVEQRGVAENPLLGRGSVDRRGNAINGISEAKQGTVTGKARLTAGDATLNGKKPSEMPSLEELKHSKKGCL
jgi:RHS repeat-associated protein